MKNITPQRAITRQAHQFIVFGGAGFAFGVFLITAAQVLTRLPLAAPGSDSESMLQTVASLLTPLGILAVLIGSLAVGRGLTFRRDNPLAQRVGDVLGQSLDNSYTFIRNINKVRYYVDGVLVGPPGVLVFRIVERSGTLLQEGDRWLKPSPDGGWLPAGFDATRECVADMKAIKTYLAAKGITTDAIFGVVVLMGNANLTEKNAKLPAATLDRVLDRVRAGYMAKPRLEPATAELIARHLRN